MNDTPMTRTPMDPPSAIWPASDSGGEGMVVVVAGAVDVGDSVTEEERSIVGRCCIQNSHAVYMHKPCVHGVYMQCTCAYKVAKRRIVFAI